MTYPAQVDGLELAVTLVTAGFALLALWALRRRAPVAPRSLRVMAVAWVAAAVLVLASLALASRLVERGPRPAEPAIEIDVVARQWMWKVQHPEGRRELNELHLPLGYPVRLRMSSEDVPHALAIPALRLKKFMFAGRETTLELEAQQKGQFVLYCAARCGPHNRVMRGTVMVMDLREYLQWARGEVPGESPLEAGRRLYLNLKCENCHRPDGAGRGPALAGLIGRTVTLREGTTLTADEDYVLESIREPDAKVVAGYEPVMPSLAGQLSESQLNALLQYLKTLEGGPR